MVRDPLHDLDDLDPSRKASQHLNSAITAGDSHEDIVILDEKLRAREDERRLSVDDTVLDELHDDPETREEVRAREARQAAPILAPASERDSVRILICTRNTAYRTLGSLAQKRLLELGTLFAEIHLIILSEAGEDTVPRVRIADNVWIYSTESSSWWRSGFDAYRIAHEQLAFAGGFRVDIIVAEDPFESGVAAYFIAQKYERPFQVHVLEDIFDEEFVQREEANRWRSYAARYVLKRADCVRTQSDFIRARVVDAVPALAEHAETLPIYYNLDAWRDMVPTASLKEKYPQFKFFVLHISAMHTKSHTREVVQGVAPLLRMYPTIGLVIVGNGPHRPAIEKQVLTLGIQSQVLFEPMPDEVVSYMKTANVLIHLSEDTEEDIVVLEAASVKLPMIASRANIAGTLFIDGESAFLCQGADPACVSQRLRDFLNDNLSCTRFAMNAQEAVFARIEQDYNAYLHAYRASVERCM